MYLAPLQQNRERPNGVPYFALRRMYIRERVGITVMAVRLFRPALEKRVCFSVPLSYHEREGEYNAKSD